MLVLIFVFSLSACGKKDTSSDKDTPIQGETFAAAENYATVLLVTINSQFKLYLDENNNVLAVEPVNDDAKTFSSEIDFENKSLETVVGTLVEKANEKGFVKENSAVKFEITEQKSETVNKEDVLQKAVSAAEKKATELKLTISFEKADNTEKNESTETDSSSEASTPNSSSKPTESKKPTSTITPNQSTPTECKHKIKYTFDNKANTWTHSGKCTLCNEYVGKSIACKDENKDNKCDFCSAKMDFGTAYLNSGFIIIREDELYDSNGKNIDYDSNFVFLKFMYSFCVYNCIHNAKAIKVDKYYFDIEYYSATEFENIARLYFNIDDSVIEQLRTLMAYRHLQTFEQYENGEIGQSKLTTIYDSATNTYSWQSSAGGGGNPELLGYKKISDIEYIAYLGWEEDILYTAKCTYNDTVKISSIEHMDTGVW